MLAAAWNATGRVSLLASCCVLLLTICGMLAGAALDAGSPGINMLAVQAVTTNRCAAAGDDSEDDGPPSRCSGGGRSSSGAAADGSGPAAVSRLVPAIPAGLMTAQPGAADSASAACWIGYDVAAVPAHQLHARCITSVY